MPLALLGLKLQIPRQLDRSMNIILGVFLGCSFKSDIMKQAYQWLPSLLSLGLFVFVIVGVTMKYFQKIGKMDAITAFFSAAPGALNLMIFMGSSMGGKEETIALIHSFRVLLVVITVPFIFRLTGGYVPTEVITHTTASILTPIDIVFLLASAIIGYYIAKKVHLPAALMTGPLICSALFHATGLSDAEVPQIVINAAQLITGSAIGCRFRNVPFDRFIKTISIALGSSTLMLIIGTIFAFIISKIINVSFPALVLAFSPGGATAMCLVSMSLGIDIAFVSTHHLIRVWLISAMLPLLFRYIKNEAKLPTE